MAKIGNKGFSSPHDILVTKAMIQKYNKSQQKEIAKECIETGCRTFFTT